jgi:hypothetical protein
MTVKAANVFAFYILYTNNLAVKYCHFYFIILILLICLFIFLVYVLINIIKDVWKLPLHESICFENSNQLVKDNYVSLHSNANLNVETASKNNFWKKTAEIFYSFLHLNFDINKSDIVEYITDKHKHKIILDHIKKIKGDIFQHIDVRRTLLKDKIDLQAELYKNSVMHIMNKNPSLSLVLKPDESPNRAGIIKSSEKVPKINTIIEQNNDDTPQKHITIKYNKGVKKIEEIDSFQFNSSELISPKNMVVKSIKSNFLKSNDTKSDEVLEEVKEQKSFHENDSGEYGIIVLHKQSYKSENNSSKLLKERFDNLSPISLMNRSADHSMFNLNGTNIERKKMLSTFEGIKSHQRSGKKHFTISNDKSVKKLSSDNFFKRKSRKPGNTTKINKKLPAGMLDDISEIDSITE